MSRPAGSPRFPASAPPPLVHRFVAAPAVMIGGTLVIMGLAGVIGRAVGILHVDVAYVETVLTVASLACLMGGCMAFAPGIAIFLMGTRLSEASL